MTKQERHKRGLRKRIVKPIIVVIKHIKGDKKKNKEKKDSKNNNLNNENSKKKRKKKKDAIDPKGRKIKSNKKEESQEYGEIESLGASIMSLHPLTPINTPPHTPPHSQRPSLLRPPSRSLFDGLLGRSNHRRNDLSGSYRNNPLLPGTGSSRKVTNSDRGGGGGDSMHGSKSTTMTKDGSQLGSSLLQLNLSINKYLPGPLFLKQPSTANVSKPQPLGPLTNHSRHKSREPQKPRKMTNDDNDMSMTKPKRQSKRRVSSARRKQQREKSKQRKSGKLGNDEEGSKRSSCSRRRKPNSGTSNHQKTPRRSRPSGRGPAQPVVPANADTKRQDLDSSLTVQDLQEMKVETPLDKSSHSMSMAVDSQRVAAAEATTRDEEPKELPKDSSSTTKERRVPSQARASETSEPCPAVGHVGEYIQTHGNCAKNDLHVDLPSDYKGRGRVLKNTPAQNQGITHRQPRPTQAKTIKEKNPNTNAARGLPLMMTTNNKVQPVTVTAEGLMHPSHSPTKEPVTIRDSLSISDQQVQMSPKKPRSPLKPKSPRYGRTLLYGASGARRTKTVKPRIGPTTLWQDAIGRNDDSANGEKSGKSNQSDDESEYTTETFANEEYQPTTERKSTKNHSSERDNLANSRSSQNLSFEIDPAIEDVFPSFRKSDTSMIKISSRDVNEAMETTVHTTNCSPARTEGKSIMTDGALMEALSKSPIEPPLTIIPCKNRKVRKRNKKKKVLAKMLSEASMTPSYVE